VTSPAARIRVWDLPTRIFHWALAVLVVFSFTTGTIGGGWMAWHLKSGYAILVLLAFRIAWGVFGSETARFGHFLRGPRAVAAYARRALGGAHAPIVGHNPLGGWMVVAMLAAIAFQASTGLFSDDEIATQGPLAVKVSNAMVSRMSGLHDVGRWVVAGLAALHVAAIATYRWAWDVRLAAPMVTGWMDAPEGASREPRARSAILAAILLAAAAAAVYVLVAIFPTR
jgi:cytochrome b